MVGLKEKSSRTTNELSSIFLKSSSCTLNSRFKNTTCVNSRKSLGSSVWIYNGISMYRKKEN